MWLKRWLTQKTNKYYWTQLGSDIDGEADDDTSGHGVSLSSDGTIIAIGAPYNNHHNGSYTNWTY